MIAERARILLWYLKRPQLYSHLLHIFLGKLSPRQARLRDSRPQSIAWCLERSISSRAAIREITGSEMPQPVDEMYQDTFVMAKQRAAECPVEMGGPGDLDLLYWLSEYCQARRAVETGVAYGWSSLALLLSLQHRDEARLISTDMPYPNRNNDRYVGCVVPTDLRSKWMLLRTADRQAIPMALEQIGEIDICHYDSDKSYAARRWAYPLLWQALQEGGIFISDDIGDNVAFRDFAAEASCNPIVVGREGKYIGVLVKPRNIEQSSHGS